MQVQLQVALKRLNRARAPLRCVAATDSVERCQQLMRVRRRLRLLHRRCTRLCAAVTATHGTHGCGGGCRAGRVWCRAGQALVQAMNVFDVESVKELLRAADAAQDLRGRALRFADRSRRRSGRRGRRRSAGSGGRRAQNVSHQINEARFECGRSELAIRHNTTQGKCQRCVCVCEKCELTRRTALSSSDGCWY